MRHLSLLVLGLIIQVGSRADNLGGGAEMQISSIGILSKPFRLALLKRDLFVDEFGVFALDRSAQLFGESIHQIDFKADGGVGIVFFTEDIGDAAFEIGAADEWPFILGQQR